MRLYQIGVLLLASAISVGAQEKDASKSKKAAKPAAPLTLTGCVQRGESTPSQFTLSEGKGGPVFHLTGQDFRDNVGRRVQIIGGLPDSKRLHIVGGLTPSPNLAAQAGAIDPSRAVTQAATDAASPGHVDLPEFKVKSVRPVAGPCAE
jgi:hypothetical protein